MGAAEHHDMKTAARAKALNKDDRQLERLKIDAELRRVAMSNAPPLTRAEAKAAVAKKTKVKQDKANNLRSARCAVFQQRKASRLTKHAPPED